MSTIFDYVGAILHTKNTEKFSSIDSEQSFQPFMINRWISMYSPEMATVINATMNKYTSLFKNKQELFSFYVSVFPKLRNKRIAYIKKSKEQKPKITEEDSTPFIAQSLELSQREVEMYKDLLKS